MELLRQKHINVLKGISLSFQRYLLSKLPWDERLIGIKGARGVGKTTLLLQYIKLHYGIITDKALYISLDELYFTEHNLTDFVSEFLAKGGEHLFLDEVHKYKNWSIELKNIYDSYPKLRIVFTGSSLLEILNARSDLSRRALVYTMQGLSYREFLNFYYKTNFKALKLSDILDNHVKIAEGITAEIKVLKHFHNYLKIGYFPFYNKNETLYYRRLQEIINMILEVELPLLRNTDISIISKIKQLLYVISQSVPFKPNISALANKIKTTRKTLLEYLHYLNDAGVLKSLNKDNFGVSVLQKPEKLYFENTNYLYAIMGAEPNIGSVREMFFLNQLSQKYTVTYPERGDFKVEDSYIFEVGGKAKTNKQIVDLKNAFIAADDIEFGYENKLPLWLFGFLY